ncbi:MAG: NAD-dependent epimerase/dehydratase family protein [Candidatus Flexifilum sp.]
MILVTGGSGFVGRHLVRQLLAAGRPVRLLLTPARAQHWTAQIAPSLPGQPVDLIVGSILDPEALFRAVSGVHTIIHLENAQWWGRARDLERIELFGTRALVEAARAARVGRIITLSHLGAAAASAYPLLRYKGLVEETIKTSGLAYTIIRSGLLFGEEDAFFNHIAMQLAANPIAFLMPGQGEVVLHPLHIDDLIQAVIRALESFDVVDRVVEIGGPEYLTLEDMLRTIMRVTGMYRVIISVPPYVVRWLMAPARLLLPRSILTPQWLDLLAANRAARIGNIFTYFGVQPRRFEDTLLTYMRRRHYGRELLRYTFRRRPHVL